MKILVTGGAGFIGSNLIRITLEMFNEIKVVNVDKLTYAGNLENLSGLEDNARYSFELADIANAGEMLRIFKGHRPDVVIHLAAESHVDRSIKDPPPFIRTNVLGTQVLLDCAMSTGVGRFVHVSTDEVYGTLEESDAAFTEKHSLNPSNPYSATKAASDMLVLAYCRTYGFPAVIARCSNNYGPYQFPEKLIPLMIRNALANGPLLVYGDGRNIRDWIHVKDHCLALMAVMENGKECQVYNIGGRTEIRNIDVVREILRFTGKPESLIRFVKDRPGHDWRYAMDIRKIEDELGWSPVETFQEGLKKTVEWYKQNEEWTDHIMSGEYERYYERVYEERPKSP